MTLDEIRGRCVVGADACWHWRGAMNSDASAGRVPIVWHEGRTSSALRVVYVLSGRALPARGIVWRTCGCDDCLRPQHLAAGSRRDWGRWRMQMGQTRPTADWLAANLRSKRARATEGGGLSLEAAAYIRASDKTGVALAHELGVSKTAVSRARRGDTWAEVAQGASVFGWRGVAA